MAKLPIKPEPDRTEETSVPANRAKPKWITSWKNAIAWHCSRLSTWAAVNTIAIGLLLVVAIVAAQEHMYPLARVLLLFAAVILLIKTYFAARKERKFGREHAAIVIIAVFGLSVPTGGLWKLISVMERNWWENLPRAYLHVEHVDANIDQGQSLTVHVAGYNISSVTPTIQNPPVDIGVVIRKEIPPGRDEEENKLFDAASWQRFIHFNTAYQPWAHFEYQATWVLPLLWTPNSKVTEDDFVHATAFKALKRGDVVLYVLVRWDYYDKYGHVPDNIARACFVFYWTPDNGAPPSRNCWGNGYQK